MVMVKTHLPSNHLEQMKHQGFLTWVATATHWTGYSQALMTIQKQTLQSSKQAIRVKWHDNILYVSFLSLRCVDSCTEQGYAYAGLQYKTQCICANEEPHGAKQNETMCDYACPGDASAKCGGHWMMNVYQIAPAGNACWVL